MSSLIERFGEGPVALACLAIAVIALLFPVVAYVDRLRWPKVKARVTDIPQRRSLASGTWSVEVEFTAPDGGRVSTRVPVNLVRQPLKLGDRVEVMHHPRHPGRTVISRTQGASTGLGIGLFFLLGAIAIFRGVSE